MGGSLGLSIRKKKLAHRVVGIVRSNRSKRLALKARAVHEATTNLQQGVRDADLVILASHVGSILETIKRIGPYLKPGTLVLDIGSTKFTIQKAAKKYLKSNIDFVGCHPMCGSEKKGVQFSTDYMYKKKICFITKRNHRAQRFWKLIGCHAF